MAFKKGSKPVKAKQEVKQEPKKLKVTADGVVNVIQGDLSAPKLG